MMSRLFPRLPAVSRRMCAARLTTVRTRAVAVRSRWPSPAGAVALGGCVAVGLSWAATRRIECQAAAAVNMCVGAGTNARVEQSANETSGLARIIDVVVQVGNPALEG
jgi:hypothetical protein